MQAIGSVSASGASWISKISYWWISPLVIYTMNTWCVLQANLEQTSCNEHASTHS